MFTYIDKWLMKHQHADMLLLVIDIIVLVILLHM